VASRRTLGGREERKRQYCHSPRETKTDMETQISSSK
jgi:hypothetical protein